VGRFAGDARWTRWLALGVILALAAALRLWSIHHVTGNNFYDAAVHSMGQSWHAFFFGALEPSAAVSIDKPPVDLWPQVAATRVLGYGLITLHLPEALSGVAACALLFGVLCRPFGELAALLGALALAVLPISVLTARSDTTDALLAVLELAAFWLSWRALRSGHARWSVLAAATLGVAFNVKLSEVLIAFPALMLLWMWAAPAGTRLRILLITLGTFVAVSLSWSAIASMTPLAQRPFPIGSGDGSIWRLIFIYNGLDRFTGYGAIGMLSNTPGGGPGLLRLLRITPSGYGSLIGAELLAVLLLGPLALLAAGRERLRAAGSSPEGRLAIGLGVWLLCGLVLFSAMRRLEPRYLEVFAPAVCALLGLAVSVLATNRRRWVDLALATAVFAIAGYAIGLDNGIGAWTFVSLVGLAAACLVALWHSHVAPGGGAGRAALIVALAVGLFAAPLGGDVNLITSHRNDSMVNDPSTPAISHYLRLHLDGARFEAASANVYDIVGVVARDGLPVMILDDVDGSLVSVAALHARVTTGQVHFYYDPHGCHAGRYCPANEQWAYAHSVPVARYRGLRRFDLAPKAKKLLVYRSVLA